MKLKQILTKLEKEKLEIGNFQDIIKTLKEIRDLLYAQKASEKQLLQRVEAFADGFSEDEIDEVHSLMEDIANEDYTMTKSFYSSTDTMDGDKAIESLDKIISKIGSREKILQLLKK